MSAISHKLKTLLETELETARNSGKREVLTFVKTLPSTIATARANGKPMSKKAVAELIQGWIDREEAKLK